MSQKRSLKRKLPLIVMLRTISRHGAQMETSIVLVFYIRPSNNADAVRSATLKEYFSKLTSNVEVLYPTQVHNGLLLCKSKRTEEKIIKMRHVLPDGSSIHLASLARHLFQSVKCVLSGSTMQLADINQSFQRCLPFLHASGGKLQVNADSSVSLEGHVFVLNAIHSFLSNKASKSPSATSSSDGTEALEVRTRNLLLRMMPGKLIEQTVEAVLIPMNELYRVHRAFDRQLKSYGGTAFSNYLKELSTKGTRPHEGEIISFPNRELKIPAKFLIAFIVPRLANTNSSKDQSSIDLFQPTYEQMIYRALNSIDQLGITSLAMPILEPSLKSTLDRRQAIRMSIRAMLSAIRLFSQNLSIKLRRCLIIDHYMQINRLSKRVKIYQNQVQGKASTSNTIDLDNDTGQSFVNIFGVPKIPPIASTSSESDDADNEPEDYLMPYIDRAKS